MSAFGRQYESSAKTASGAILPVKQHGERLLSGIAQQPPMTDLGRLEPFGQHRGMTAPGTSLKNERGERRSDFDRISDAHWPGLTLAV
jgi:hypothetical protein